MRVCVWLMYGKFNKARNVFFPFQEFHVVVNASGINNKNEYNETNEKKMEIIIIPCALSYH